MNLIYDREWLGLVIGNSRLHWAQFKGELLINSWDSAYDYKIDNTDLPLYIASVVPGQTNVWLDHPNCRIISLHDIPLEGLYLTLGLDRALAAIGAIDVYGCPNLVIDAGTALTFTGVDCDRTLVGGAILPGFGLQLQSLAQKTAELPQVILPSNLPTRWPHNTPEAIASGIVYTVLAGIRDFIDDWQQKYPDSKFIVTGGDGELLLNYRQLPTEIIFDRHLVFWGMKFVIQKKFSI